MTLGGQECICACVRACVCTKTWRRGGKKIRVAKKRNRVEETGRGWERYHYANLRSEYNGRDVFYAFCCSRVLS